MLECSDTEYQVTCQLISNWFNSDELFCNDNNILFASKDKACYRLVTNDLLENFFSITNCLPISWLIFIQVLLKISADFLILKKRDTKIHIQLKAVDLFSFFFSIWGCRQKNDAIAYWEWILVLVQLSPITIFQIIINWWESTRFSEIFALFVSVYKNVA